MPADSGVAFVLIPHLDPKHESLMVELISRHTRMPVVEAEDGMAALANHVYIIPPNKYMTISGGVLRLSGPVERGGPQTSIDLFLRSNEESSTVNNQLRDKVNDLETANNDIANFLDCTDIATIFLDFRFCIRRFNPAATRLFNLIPTDVGRSIGDIVKRFADDDLLKDAEQFLRDPTPREKEVRLDDGGWCLRRIVPYRTLDNRIDGVVLTFVDISERKHAADAVVRRLAAIVESSADAIFSKDLDGTVRTWNAGAQRLYGYAADEILGRSILTTIPQNHIEAWRDAMARLARGEHVEQMERSGFGRTASGSRSR